MLQYRVFSFPKLRTLVSWAAYVHRPSTYVLLDLTTFEIHVARVAKAGMSPLVAGSMGEAVHLSHSERTTLIRLARTTLDSAGFYHIPVIAGTGAASTRETIELTKEASKAGADYAIVIAGGYYGSFLSNDRAALKGFFRDVSQNSPIPIMIYNCKPLRCSNPRYRIFNTVIPDPSSSGNIDLDSDIIVELAQECPNTCGVKLTYVVDMILSIANTSSWYMTTAAVMLVN